MAKKKSQPSAAGFIEVENKAVVSVETKEPKKKAEKKAATEFAVEADAVEADAAPAVEADTTSEEPAPESAE